MKLRTLFVALACSAFLGASAQEPEVKTEFVPHWYLQLQGGASHTLGEAKFMDLVSPAAQIALGRQFNPVLGVRLEGHGWQAKGGWPTSQMYPDYKFNFAGVGLDLRVNLSNLLCGWNPDRFFNVGLFVGGAANIGWGNDEAMDLSKRPHGALDRPYIITQDELEYAWDGTQVLPMGRAGIDLDFRVSDRFSINVEGNANVLSDKFNSKKAGNADWYFNALAGVKIALGETVRRTTIIPPKPVIIEPEPEPEPIVEPEPEPEPVPETKAVNVFFNIRSSEILPEEQAKLDEMIAFLKANPNAKVKLASYADIGTGNATLNQGYSEDRTAAVTKALLDAGIDASRIVKSESKGDTEQPFSENDKNRVSIIVAE